MSSQEGNTQHTPGPWFAIFNDCYFDISLENRRYSVGIAAAWVNIPGEDQKSIAEANAHLIAAAPDLLDAAIWCKSLCEETNATATNAYAAACAAIAKAEGRQ